MADGDSIAGILTDGDVRRLVSKHRDLTAFTSGEVMTPAPKTIDPDLLAADAVSLADVLGLAVLLEELLSQESLGM